MELFDTPSQKLAYIEPRGDVLIYVCGITPYDSAHLGHVFTFLAYDLLKRRFEDRGHTVKIVRNITDVDEPIYVKAAANGEDYRQLAKRETESFQATMRQLNFDAPYAEPKASEYIPEMAAAVAKLVQAGYGYHLDEDIYFDISKTRTSYGQFGDFAGFSDRLRLAFMADRGGDPQRPGKRNQLDFLLWRGVSNPTDPAAWESPVGRGRPGWHIECSIMSAHTLDIPLTIHGGGMDLIFPHHECEIAQTAALGTIGALKGSVLADHWMHVAPILYQGEKMSKSLGNLVFARDLLQRHNPSVIRLAMMQLHYRTGGEWRHDALRSALVAYAEITRALAHPHQIAGSKFLDQIRAALDDDLDTHTVLHVLQDCLKATFEQSMGTPESAMLNSTTTTKHPAPTTAQTQLESMLLLLGLAHNMGGTVRLI